MYIADPESKRVSTKHTPDDVKADRERARERERREFIRSAAIELYASGECVLADGAWAAAERLWNARPEDC